MRRAEPARFCLPSLNSTDKGKIRSLCSLFSGPSVSTGLTSLRLPGDPGTYDAISLSSVPLPPTNLLPSELYPTRITRLIKPGGFFLITCGSFFLRFPRPNRR